MLKKVSIIIPVYNVEKYLKQCLDSVVNQTLEDIEVICINDCSPDNSLKILEEYASKDNRIKIINNETNLGQGISRNNAIKIASGEYIMFLDSDDWLELNACEIAYNQIASSKDDFIYFNFNRYYEDTNQIIPDTKRLKQLLARFGEFKSFSITDLKMPIAGYGPCYKIYSRRFLVDNNVLFESARCFEDLPFFIKALVSAKKISVINRILYNYRQNDKSAMHNPYNYVEMFKMRRVALDIILNSKYKDSYLNYYIASHIKSIMYHFKLWVSMNIKIKKDFYKLMKNEFEFINNNYSVAGVKQYINYKNFLDILKYNFFVYELLEILPNIFSVKNEIKNGKKRKIIVFFGINIKISLKAKTRIKYED